MRTRIYEFDEDYFETINTADKAYWLGFIAADGYITKRAKGKGQNVFGITLHEKEPLEKLNQCMNSNKRILEYDNSKYFNKHSDKKEYKLLFVSNKLVSDLEKNGIVERKTFKLEFPFNIISEDLYSHYLRGYFDGDGSVFYSSAKGKKDEILCVNICGTKSFLTSVKDNLLFLNKEDKCLYKDERVTSDCWNLKLYNQHRALAFYQFIYKDYHKNIYLERKKQKFDDYIDMKVQRLQSAILDYTRIKV